MAKSTRLGRSDDLPDESPGQRTETRGPRLVVGPNQPADDELFNRFVRGDTTALEELLRRYEPPVIAWLLKTGIDPQDCDDLLQVIRLGILQAAVNRRLGAGDPIINVEGYIWRLARNKHADYCEARSKRQKLIDGYVAYDEADTGEPCWATPLPLDDRALVHLAIAIVNQPGNPYAFKIQDTDQEMLRLWLDGMTYAQVAQVIGGSTARVGERINKYLRRLSKQAAVYLETLDLVFDEQGERYL